MEEKTVAFSTLPNHRESASDERKFDAEVAWASFAQAVFCLAGRGARRKR